jgi:hypothetical protein
MAIHASLKASPSFEFTGFTPVQIPHCDLINAWLTIVRFSTGSLVMGPSSASAFGTVNW